MTRRLSTVGFLLGFALGGFFDGILLHQILQWHHLLSAIEGPAARDIGLQVLADGLFHALMYVIALAGLIILWRARAAFAGARGAALSAAALGFGVWHLLDALLSHWLLGIHRVRMDSAQPLLWDVGWLLLFGALPMAFGLLSRGRHDGGRAATGLLVALVIGGGAAAAMPPPGRGDVVAYFGPGGGARAIKAAAALDARLLWVDGSGEIWGLALPRSESAWRLYRHGALLVGGATFGGGCLAWARS